MQAPVLADYNYELPEDRIAKYPLHERDMAKLLIYHGGEIKHKVFKDLADYLPDNSLLVFNNTRVVQARLFFKRNTGATIEVFCLKPLEPYTEISQAMQAKGYAVWECMGGKQKRWKEGEIITLELPSGQLWAKLLEKDGRIVKVSFTWPDTMSWAEVLEAAGHVPLPPYIDRTDNTEDKEEYQTVFAKEKGAVAAPTAGLHFTDALLEKLKQGGVAAAELTLHVGAGTFQPVEVEDVLQHPMHNEQITFDRAFIELIRDCDKKIIQVGTTSMRAMESLYWFACKIEEDSEIETFFIPKLYPYEYQGRLLSRKEAMQNVLSWMRIRSLDTIWGQTEIFIFPGNKFKMSDGLITNFHLPQSTLLMLVSALIGDDWKRIYAEAMEKDYRFLSYGDGSLLLP
jgi:S-adenosylmethionine:tRNA ribosyltransferase-isomerase